MIFDVPSQLRFINSLVPLLRGDLIFTVETLSEGDWRWVLQAIERYAHHPDYVRDVAVAVGLEPRAAVPFQPRMESGLPVRGTLHVMHKPR